MRAVVTATVAGLVAILGCAAAPGQQESEAREGQRAQVEAQEARPLSNPAEDHERRWCVVDSELAEGNVWGCYSDRDRCEVMNDARLFWLPASRGRRQTASCKLIEAPSCIDPGDPDAGLREECFAGEHRAACSKALEETKAAGWRRATCAPRWAGSWAPYGRSRPWCALYRGEAVVCVESEELCRQFAGRHPAMELTCRHD